MPYFLEDLAPGVNYTASSMSLEQVRHLNVPSTPAHTDEALAIDSSSSLENIPMEVAGSQREIRRKY
jgi:hypothetical protein